MIDIQILRKNIDIAAARLAIRKFHLDISTFIALEIERKKIQSGTEILQNKRNNLSKQVSVLKNTGKDSSTVITEIIDINHALKLSLMQLEIVLMQIKKFLLSLPNLPHISVQTGSDENSNIELRKVGIPRFFNFNIRDHVDIGIATGLDFDAATKLTSSRFVVMKGSIARLHRILTQFMLDMHTLEHGYTEYYIPYIVNSKSLYGTGQLPKFKHDLFAVNKGEQEIGIIDDSLFYLIPTAEVSLINLVRDEIITVDKLPLKFVAHSPCFRSEVGNYGRDTRGMIRQHQFDKVEIVQIVHPDKSYEVLDEMVYHVENILKKLDLPYRVMNLCGADMGFSAAKTYDIEVWLPAQGIYREISSISNCEAFQARRMQTRFRNKQGKLNLVHTLNGSGLAIGRTLAAILENGQQEDGSVIIPQVLESYMGGLNKLIPN